MSDSDTGVRDPAETKKLLDAIRALAVNPAWVDILAPRLKRLFDEARTGRNNVSTSAAERETWLWAVIQGEQIDGMLEEETGRLEEEWKRANGGGREDGYGRI